MLFTLFSIFFPPPAIFAGPLYFGKSSYWELRLINGVKSMGSELFLFK